MGIPYVQNPSGGGGDITGSGENTRVAFWNGNNSITGSNLFLYSGSNLYVTNTVSALTISATNIDTYTLSTSNLGGVQSITAGTIFCSQIIGV